MVLWQAYQLCKMHHLPMNSEERKHFAHSLGQKCLSTDRSHKFQTAFL